MKKLEPMRRQIKAGQNALNMADDAYQSMLIRITGKTSSKQLSLAEINTVLKEYERLGWKPTNKRDKQIRLIKFLWLRLGEENVLDNPNLSAMYAYCRKSIGSKKANVSLYKASSHSLNNIIESLKDWCKREGVATGNVK